MGLYQRRNLTTSANVGAPAVLPEDLVGLDDASLADLSAALAPAAAQQLGYVGVGFLPMAEPEPAAPRNIPQLAFLQRIPAAQRIAIRTVGKTDPIIEDFLDLLRASTLVDLDHADTLAGVGYLVAQNHLTAPEAEALLA